MGLKPLPYREVKRKLEAAGFSLASIKGGHVKFVQTSSSGTKVVIVPKHREISIGT